jgi:hypothetical protein
MWSQHLLTFFKKHYKIENKYSSICSIVIRRRRTVGRRAVILRFLLSPRLNFRAVPFYSLQMQFFFNTASSWRLSQPPFSSAVRVNKFPTSLKISDVVIFSKRGLRRTAFENVNRKKKAYVSLLYLTLNHFEDIRGFEHHLPLFGDLRSKSEGAVLSTSHSSPSTQ